MQLGGSAFYGVCQSSLVVPWAVLYSFGFDGAVPTGSEPTKWGFGGGGAGAGSPQGKVPREYCP